jgi:hypothetical protein
MTANMNRLISCVGAAALLTPPRPHPLQITLPMLHPHPTVHHRVACAHALGGDRQPMAASSGPLETSQPGPRR